MANEIPLAAKCAGLENVGAVKKSSIRNFQQKIILAQVKKTYIALFVFLKFKSMSIERYTEERMSQHKVIFMFTKI